MNLREQIEAKLNRLMSDQPREGRLSIDTGNGHLNCKFASVNDLACAIVELHFQPANRDISFDAVRRSSEILSDRLNYLLEPIKPIETDAEQGVVQMRSCPPNRQDKSTSYYEVVLQGGGELSLCRYTKSRGNPRRLMPANVTREVFGHLVSDLATIGTDS